MLKVGGFSIGSVVLCELIRPEANNKLSILGVFAADIVISNFPANLGLAAYIEFTPKKTGTSEMEFRFTTPGGAVEIKTEVQIIEIGPSAMPLPTLPMTVNEPGAVILETRVDGSDWVKILEKRIVSGEVSPFPPQPLT